MTENAEERRGIGGKGTGECTAERVRHTVFGYDPIAAEKHEGDYKGKEGLEHIKQEREESGAHAEDPLHIGGTRVMAALRADVGVVEHAGDENGGVDTAEQIGNHHDEEKQGNVQGAGGSVGPDMQPVG